MEFRKIIVRTDHGDPRDPRLHPKPEHARDARILGVAEHGYSMLREYCSHKERPFTKLEKDEDVQAFSDRINATDTAEYLPSQRVAAVPQRFFRELATCTDSEHLEQFKSILQKFFLSHAHEFAGTNLFVDYRVSPAPVPMKYIEATIDVLNSLPAYGGVRRVMFFQQLRDGILPADFDNRADFERLGFSGWPRGWS